MKELFWAVSIVLAMACQAAEWQEMHVQVDSIIETAVIERAAAEEAAKQAQAEMEAAARLSGTILSEDEAIDLLLTLGAEVLGTEGMDAFRVMANQIVASDEKQYWHIGLISMDLRTSLPHFYVACDGSVIWKGTAFYADTIVYTAPGSGVRNESGPIETPAP